MAAAIRKKISDLDLLRVGVYSQVEGSFGMVKGGGDRSGYGYRFTFFLNQISDMEELLGRVLQMGVEKYNRKGLYVSFYSKDLYERISDMGFERFSAYDWNVPRCTMQSESLKVEYLRALIDSLGDVDVYRTTPYIRIGSVNRAGLYRVAKIYGGTLLPYEKYNYLQWVGKDAMRVGDYLGWRFYCWRNIRGAELARNVKWDIY